MKNFCSLGRVYGRLALLAVLSCVLVVCMPMMSALSASWFTNWQVLAPAVAQVSTAESLLKQGIQLYEAEQFTAAAQRWEQALTAPALEKIDTALVYNNLSLAYQQLGRWTEAEAAIATSLALLAEPPSHSSAQLATLGKALNTLGRLQWSQGDVEAALATWRESTAAYAQAGHERGVLLSSINQAKALQVQGLHSQSQEVLKQNVKRVLQQTQLDSKTRATGLWQLGNAQRQFGKLDDSKTTLLKSLEVIDDAQMSSLRAAVLLDLGNTERSLGESAIAIGKTDEAVTHRVRAIESYQQAVRTATTPTTQLQATLNQLSLFIDAERWLDAEALWPTLLPQIETLSPSRTAIYSQLNFAKSLTRLKQSDNAKLANNKQAIKSVPDWSEIDRLLLRAIDQASDIDDPIAASYGIGQRGELYELAEQLPTAQALTQQALELTESAQYLNGRYRWEWQLGRLLKRQKHEQEAIKAYTAAVQTLDLVRNDLLFVDAEVQFSFRDNVEPVYRELVDLLIGPQESSNISQANLEQAIHQIDNLQLSELENFLRCNLAQTTTINQFETDVNTALLYPIILENRLVVILQLPGEKKVAQVVISQQEVNSKLEQLRRNLGNAPNRTPEVIETATEVYQWLIKPFESDLEQYDQIDTLVFVLDGRLRNIPMAVLYDGNDYLIQKYAVAVSPQLELFTPSALPEKLTVFTGGIGQPQRLAGQEFAEIKKLTEELDEISRLSEAAPPLIEQDFQKETLQQQIGSGEFSAIHIKTHGIFSSDPEETFIVAYKELIRGRELGDLIQAGSRQGQIPIELLVLSACSTAEGDNRAVLGLAGVAVRAGARSTISTLWEAQDEPNTKFMIQFYQELQKPGTTRAQALRKAQLTLMKQRRSPYIWATYVLVGNWL